MLEDPSGHELARIQEKKISVRDKIAVERDGDTVATVHKALVGIRDRFAIDVAGGKDLKAYGNVVDHEYEIERDGDTVATISKKWFRVRDSYGVDVACGRGRRADPPAHSRDRRANDPLALQGHGGLGLALPESGTAGKLRWAHTPDLSTTLRHAARERDGSCAGWLRLHAGLDVHLLVNRRFVPAPSCAPDTLPGVRARTSAILPSSGFRRPPPRQGGAVARIG